MQGGANPLVNIVPLRVGIEEARRIATKEIFEGYSRPEDIRSATVGEAVLYYLPVWRVAVEMAGFHLGLGSLSRRSSPDIHARLGSHVHVLPANRSFPIVHIPYAAIRGEPEAMLPGDPSTLPGSVLPVDVWQQEAEREAVSVAMRAVASNRALLSHYEPRLWTALGYWPLVVVRYHYEGSGRRYFGEEYFVTISGRTGAVTARHHPAGVGLFGAMGRFLGVSDGTPVAHAPRPPPPAPPPPAPPRTYEPPPVPPAPRPPAPAPHAPIHASLPRVLDPSQAFVVSAALSLAEARARIARAILDAPLGSGGIDVHALAAPQLFHMPMWRIRLRHDAVLRPRAHEALPAVFAERGVKSRRTFLVTATSILPDAALPLAELGGFHAPDVSGGAIAVASRASLEVGATLLDQNVSQETAVRELPPEADVEYAMLIHVPFYVQSLSRGYVVVSGRSGAVLGMRHRIARAPRAVTPRESADHPS